MFDRFTEEARKAVFYARYEASQTGSDHIETEHLLLGLLRPEAPLARRLLRTPARIIALREQTLRHFPPRPATPTSGDMPLSRSAKRVLAKASEEARRAKAGTVTPDDLLLAILQEPSCPAATVLREHGITAAQIADDSAGVPAPVEGVRDMVEEAAGGGTRPLVGREREVERILQILSRRTKNNPVLIGEAGIGKTAIIEGLASRFASGELPPCLSGRPLVSMDATDLTVPGRRSRSSEQLESIVANYTGGILFIRGLFNLAAAGSLWAVLEAMHALEPQLAHGAIQCIATGSPAGLRETAAKAGLLARHFEVVEVKPVSEEDAIRIVSGLKTGFETFHHVTFTEEAIQAAVRASGPFLPGRHLPDRAIDLVDEAAAAVKLAGEKRVVMAGDVEEAIAARAGMPVEEVRRVLAEQDMGQFDRISAALAAQLPIEARTWIPFLAAYLARSSPAEAEALAETIEDLFEAPGGISAGSA